MSTRPPPPRSNDRCRRRHLLHPPDPGEHLAPRLFAPASRRARDRALGTIEESIVRGITALLDDGVEPFALLGRLRLSSARAVSSVVVVNALLAASHAAFLAGRARGQIEFLAVAGIDVVAGVGWLRRLDRALPLDRVGEAALEMWSALVDVDLDVPTWCAPTSRPADE